MTCSALAYSEPRPRNRPKLCLVHVNFLRTPKKSYERKLITITGDNASNNESMVSALYESLRRKYGHAVRCRDPDSYVRCLAHILNLIVQDILHALKSGNAGEACAMCNSLSNRKAKHAPLRTKVPWILAL
ncbi:hypothetical protein V1523DRAFT_203903 [Lipomyces doorenjongii]